MTRPISCRRAHLVASRIAVASRRTSDAVPSLEIRTSVSRRRTSRYPDAMDIEGWWASLLGPADGDRVPTMPAAEFARVRNETPTLSRGGLSSARPRIFSVGAITPRHTVNTAASSRGPTSGVPRGDVSGNTFGILVLRRRERCAPLYLYTYKRRRARREFSVSLSLCFSSSLGKAANNPLAGLFSTCRIVFYMCLSFLTEEVETPKSEGQKNRERERVREKERGGKRASGHPLCPPCSSSALPPLVLRSRPPAGCWRLLLGERDASRESLRPSRLSRPRGPSLSMRGPALFGRCHTSPSLSGSAGVKTL